MHQAVIFILVTPDKKLLLERKSALHPRDPGKVLLPGGQVEAGETPEQAVRRELVEEFGIKDVRLELFFHSFRHVQRANQEYELFYYIIKGWDGKYAVADFDELVLVDFTEKGIELIDLPENREVLRMLLKK